MNYYKTVDVITTDELGRIIKSPREVPKSGEEVRKETLQEVFAAGQKMYRRTGQVVGTTPPPSFLHWLKKLLDTMEDT
jgi:hypothetical protein